MRNYLGPFNRSKNCLYGQVKVRTTKTFKEIKEHVIEWQHKDLHWMKADYIQACQISNIGILTGSCSAVNMQGTRLALESAGHHVKLDMSLHSIKCKSSLGQNVTTTIYIVSVDSRQVSEAVKGLRAVLNKQLLSPTGHRMSLITRYKEDPTIQQKNNNILAQHHEAVVSERTFYRKIGASLLTNVTLCNGNVHTPQQALCTISNKEDGICYSLALKNLKKMPAFLPYTKRILRKENALSKHFLKYYKEC